MVVALDGTPLTLSSGGLRRYTEQLHAALRAEFPADNFALVSDQLKLPRNMLERRWWTIGLPLALRRMEAAIFHGTDFAVPYVPVCASVMTVHDLSPWIHPEWHAARSVARVRKRTPRLIRLGLATLLITPTEAVRQQVMEWFRVAPDRVVAVPEGVSALPEPEEPIAMQDRPYFLFVGTVEPRKNVPALIAAWRELRLCGHDADLVIAGRFRGDAPLIREEPGLQLAGEVSDTELALLYRGAVAVMYPSLYEGFGLPVVEAMQYGTPVIASSDPALKEVAGGAALHAGSDAELVSAMQGVLTSAELRDQLRVAGLRRAAEFTWQRTATLTREVYAEAIRRHNGTYSRP